MAIDSQRLAVTISITGASQETTTREFMGKIDQMIVQSSTAAQSIDLVLLNENSEEIYRNDGLFVNQTRSDLRPHLLPRSALTVRIANPVNQSGTVTVTFIEQKHV